MQRTTKKLSILLTQKLQWLAKCRCIHLYFVYQVFRLSILYKLQIFSSYTFLGSLDKAFFSNKTFAHDTKEKENEKFFIVQIWWKCNQIELYASIMQNAKQTSLCLEHLNKHTLSLPSINSFIVSSFEWNIIIFYYHENMHFLINHIILQRNSSLNSNQGIGNNLSKSEIVFLLQQ